jgi:hypothetical protein
VSISGDKLYYETWEYDMEKPVDIVAIPKPITYYDLYLRKIMVTISETEKIQTIFLNVDGERVPSDYVDKRNRHVQSFLESYELKGGQWLIIEKGNIYIHNGLVAIRNHTERRFVGDVHILITYRFEEVSNITTPTHYTLPENYRKILARQY